MDVRLTSEQQQLRDAAAKLADDLGPARWPPSTTRSNRQAGQADRVTGWRSLRSDGASGVEVAIVAEEFGRGLVDAPFLGPVLADDLLQLGRSGQGEHVVRRRARPIPDVGRPDRRHRWRGAGRI